MKRKYILILFVILVFDISFAQQINFRFNEIESEKAVLYTLAGENISFVDTITCTNISNFKFSLDNSHSGIYRLSLTNSKWLDFIYDKEDVQIETDANNILDSLNVIESESNKLYYVFLKLNKDYKTQTELLQLILARYPNDDNYYQITKEILIQIQEDYLYFVNITSQVEPNSFIASYVGSAQLPVVDIETPFDEQLTYLKTHSLDNINFYDDGLIYSDAFTNKVIEYLTYFRNPQLPKELLEKEFMAAVDTLLTKAKVNPIVYQHIVEYLIDGFRKFGFDQSIDYIVENYVIKDDLCLDEKLGNTIERRIQQARNFKIGSVVPSITFQDSSGSLIELNKINADRTLIIFYASWCPHCQTLVPQVFDLYKNQADKRFEVLAISIDISRVDWLEFIRDNNLNWYNFSDGEGWEGRAALDYYIYATPTMFLVDKQLKLIAKPSSLEELHTWF